VEDTGKGAEVAGLVDSFQPDVVILEFLLQDMSGLETGRIIKGTRKATRIIFYSHCLPPRNLSTWGGDDFVVKSHDLRRLKEAVRRLVRA
jgi:DNA-binding response OmpR family regulator